MEGITFNFAGNIGHFISCIQKTFFIFGIFDGAVLELWGANFLPLWCCSAMLHNINGVLIHLFILSNMEAIFGSDKYI